VLLPKRVESFLPKRVQKPLPPKATPLLIRARIPKH
jgi:hypothetical protein